MFCFSSEFFLFGSFSFACFFSELAVLAIFLDIVPQEKSSVHSNENPTRKCLRKSESCAEIKKPIGASEGIWNHRAGEDDRFAVWRSCEVFAKELCCLFKSVGAVSDDDAFFTARSAILENEFAVFVSHLKAIDHHQRSQLNRNLATSKLKHFGDMGVFKIKAPADLVIFFVERPAGNEYSNAAHCLSLGEIRYYAYNEECRIEQNCAQLRWRNGSAGAMWSPQKAVFSANERLRLPYRGGFHDNAEPVRIERSKADFLLEDSMLKYAKSGWCFGSLCLGAMLTLTSCETLRTMNDNGNDSASTVPAKERESVLPVPASRATNGGSAVLVVAEFHGLAESDSEIRCRWRITNRDTGKSYFLNLEPGKPNVFITADPGTYKTGRLGCGISRVWEVTDVFKDGFKVDSGHVSYLGKLTLNFKEGDLDVIHEASRAESAKSFLSAIAAVNGSTKGAPLAAISAFTEKPLDQSMISGTEASEGFNVFAKGIDDPNRTLNPLIANLQTCSRSEAATDPLRFGRLEYIAAYKDGRFSEMKERQEANAFSDHLRSCVERGIMAFHPPQKNDVEVRVRY